MRPALLFFAALVTGFVLWGAAILLVIAVFHR